SHEGKHHDPAQRFHRWRCWESTNSTHSALTPDALTIGYHFSISALWNAANAAGVRVSAGGKSMPRSAMRWRITGSAIAALAAALILSTISAGVFFGAQKPCQVLK